MHTATSQGTRFPSPTWLFLISWSYIQYISKYLNLIKLYLHGSLMDSLIIECIPGMASSRNLSYSASWGIAGHLVFGDYIKGTGPPGWKLDMSLTTSPCKKILVKKYPTENTGQVSCRWLGTKRELRIGPWNVRILFMSGALKNLID